MLEDDDGVTSTMTLEKKEIDSVEVLDAVASIVDKIEQKKPATQWKKTHYRVYLDPCPSSTMRERPSSSSHPDSQQSLSHHPEDFLLFSPPPTWQDTQAKLLDARMNDLNVSRDTERENLHLYLSEMLISAIEQMKWRNDSIGHGDGQRQDDGQRQGDGQRHGDGQSSSSPIQCPTTSVMVDGCFGSDQSQFLSPDDSSIPSTLSSSFADIGGSSPLMAMDREVVGDKRSSRFYTTLQQDQPGTSTPLMHPEEDAESIHAGCVGEEEDENSPESVALALLRHFSTVQPPKSAAEIEWLVSYAQAPQMLLPMPSSIAVGPGEISANGKTVRLRGTVDWAPPRPQWIFTLHQLPKKLSTLLTAQRHRCAGCGMKVDRKVYARRVRYCDYYGRLFCQCCHQGAKARTPARILHQWNFKEYPVCDLAARFLRAANDQPVINVPAVDVQLYQRIRVLRRVHEMRGQLVHMWPFISTCRTADDVVTKYGNLSSLFTSKPQHLLRDADVYSMADLIGVYTGDLPRSIEPLIQYGRCHIEVCNYCRSKAFVCELCDRPDDLLFPFQLDKVHRCDDCGSLSHQKCVKNRRSRAEEQWEKCPKCVRIRNNEFRRSRAPSESSTTGGGPAA